MTRNFVRMVMVSIVSFLALTAKADTPMTVSDAFALGSSTGSSSKSEVFGSVSTTNATTNLPSYGTTAPEASYFGGGTGNTMLPGQTKISGCGTTPPSDAAGAMECNAINYLNNIGTYKPAIGLTKNDPLFMKGKEIRNDPGAIAENLGKNYEACKASTTIDSGSTTFEVCHEALSVSQSTCQVNRVVKVAIDRTYQCIDTKSVISTQTCNKQLAVSVAWFNSCTPGSYFGNFWVNTWGNGEVGRRWAGIIINAYCAPDAATMQFSMNATCTESPCSGSAVFAVNAANGATSPQAFTNFVGRSWYSTDYFNRVTYEGGSCNATNCNFTFSTAYADSSCYWDDYSGFVCNSTYIIRARGTFSFVRPHSYHVDTDSWTDNCSQLNARTL